MATESEILGGLELAEATQVTDRCFNLEVCLKRGNRSLSQHFAQGLISKLYSREENIKC